MTTWSEMVCQDVEENYTRVGTPQIYILSRIPIYNESPEEDTYYYSCNCEKNYNRKLFFRINYNERDKVIYSIERSRELCIHITNAILKEEVVTIYEYQGITIENFKRDTIQHNAFRDIIYQRLLRVRPIKQSDPEEYPQYNIKNKNNTWSCTCKGFKYHKHCKHIKNIQKEEIHKQNIREVGISLAIKYKFE